MQMVCKTSKVVQGRLYSAPIFCKAATLSVLVVVFCFAECAAGACMTYGHACWGAHGKRNGGEIPGKMPAIPLDKNRSNSRWFLSRLVQSPVDLRLLLSKDMEEQRPRFVDSPPRRQLFSGPSSDDQLLNGKDDWDAVAPDFLEEMYEDRDSSLETNKLKAAKFLDKRSIN